MFMFWSISCHFLKNFNDTNPVTLSDHVILEYVFIALSAPWCCTPVKCCGKILLWLHRRRFYTEIYHFWGEKFLHTLPYF